MFGLVALPVGLSSTDPSAIRDALFEPAVDAEVRGFVSNSRDLLRAIEKGLTLEEALRRGVGYFETPSVRRMGHAGLVREGRLHSLLVSVGVADPFGVPLAPRGHSIIKNGQIGGARELVTRAMEGWNVRARPPTPSSEDGFLAGFQRTLDDAVQAGTDVVIEWTRSPLGTVNLSCAGVETTRIEEALRRKDTRIVVELAKRRFREKFEARELGASAGKHICAASIALLLARRSKRLQFAGHPEALAFRVLASAAGLSSWVAGRSSGDHQLVQLTEEQLNRLRTIAELPTRKGLDLSALAADVGYAADDPGFVDIIGEVGSVRLSIEEEVGPEVAAFLKKCPRQAETMFLAACSAD